MTRQPKKIVLIPSLTTFEFNEYATSGKFDEECALHAMLEDISDEEMLELFLEMLDEIYPTD